MIKHLITKRRLFLAPVILQILYARFEFHSEFYKNNLKRK